MVTDPRVSIVIPAYNAAKFVAESVESALAQTWSNLEVVVVDDGSTDDTLAVLERFGDRIVVVRAEHGGLRRTRDVGQAHATGELIAWMDADDLAVPERIEVQVEALRRFPEASVVTSDFESFTEDGPYPVTVRSYYYRLDEAGTLEQLYGPATDVEACGRMWPVRCASIRDEVPFAGFPHPPTLMARRAALEQVEPRGSVRPVADDWIQIAQLSDTGDFAFVDAPLLKYRHHPEQVTAPKDPTRLALDALLAAETIMESRPDLKERFPERVRRVMGINYGTVAEAMSNDPGLGALRYLALSARGEGFTTWHLKTALRTLTPRVLLRAYRRAKGSA